MQILLGLGTLSQEGWNVFCLSGELFDVVLVPSYLILEILESLLLGIKDVVLSLSCFRHFKYSISQLSQFILQSHFNLVEIGVTMQTDILHQLFKLFDIISELISSNFEQLLVINQPDHSIFMNSYFLLQLIELSSQPICFTMSFSSASFCSVSGFFNYVTKPSIALQLLIDPVLHGLDVFGNLLKCTQSIVIFLVDHHDWTNDFFEDCSQVVF